MDAESTDTAHGVDAPATGIHASAHPRWATAGWGLVFAFLCFLMIVVAMESALHFVGSAIDGPFQLYNSLRRIWIGQRAGVDFQFFHGLGIPYLHYIPFRLMGGGFLDSEMVRELMSTILYPLSVVVFLRFFLRDWTRTLAWSSIVMIASIALRLTSVLVAINSLLGIRSTLPVLFPVALCFRSKPWVRTVLAGLVLGGALVMGTEQGLALGAGVVIAFAVVAVRTHGRARWTHVAEAAAILAIGVATLVVLLLMAGGVAGMRGALAYNFRIIPMDQYWYFGAPPNLFLSSWGVIPRMMSKLPRIPISLLIGAAAAIGNVVWLWRRPSDSRSREQIAFTVLASYGIISCASLLGTYVNAYIQPLLRVLLLMAALSASRWMPAYDRSHGRRLIAGVGQSVVVTALAVTGLMFAILPTVASTISETIPHFIMQHVVRGIGPVYGEIWPETITTGQAFIDAHRDSAGKPPMLWSTYAGLLEARNGLVHPTVDYIIHALGPEGRAKYVEDFERLRPPIVQTVSPSYTQYEAWIESTSWDFYVSLLRHYDLAGGTPWSLFWTWRDSTRDPPLQVWATKILPGSDGIQLPKVPGAPGDSAYVLYQVEMEYQVHNPLHVLPIVGSSPRYLVRALNAVQRDAVTLDPYVTRSRFPLIVQRGSQPVLQWATYSLLPGASIEVKAVGLSLVRLSPRNGEWLSNLIDQQTGRLETFR